LIFVYIIFAGISLYFVLRYAIRDAIIESETNKEKLVYTQKSSDLFNEICSIYTKDFKNIKRAKEIYNQSFNIFISGEDPKYVLENLMENKKQILSLYHSNE